MARLTGADLPTGVGAALDATELAVDNYREVSTLTSSERKRLNEAMDDFSLAAERLKLAHQRLLERAANPQLGG